MKLRTFDAPFKNKFTLILRISRSNYKILANFLSLFNDKTDLAPSDDLVFIGSLESSIHSFNGEKNSFAIFSLQAMLVL